MREYSFSHINENNKHIKLTKDKFRGSLRISFLHLQPRSTYLVTYETKGVLIFLSVKSKLRGYVSYIRLNSTLCDGFKPFYGTPVLKDMFVTAQRLVNCGIYYVQIQIYYLIDDFFSY